MSDTADQKVLIEHAIEKARNGVSERIDEIDSRLRTQLDVKRLASEYAPQLVVGGAVVGFLAAFGLPKGLRRVIQIGVPLAFFAYKVKRSVDTAADELEFPEI
jgi:hypothetical protein